MATYEKNALFTRKDASGNKTLLYPITKKDCVDGMEEIDAHIVSQDNPHNVTAEQVGAASADHEHLFDRGVTTSGDGAAYTVTLDGITALEAGLSFVMVPHTNSTSTNATLNVNSLGAKYIRQRLSTNTSVSVAGATANWIISGKPVRVTYNGTYWVAELTRPDANTIYGTVPVASGGVPTCTTDDNGKFLRVVEGIAAWVTVDSAETTSF